MKLVDVSLIYQDLCSMEDLKLPVKLSYRLDQLIGRLERHALFFADKEKQLVIKWNPKNIRGTTLEFETQEDAARISTMILKSTGKPCVG